MELNIAIDVPMWYIYLITGGLLAICVATFVNTGLKLYQFYIEKKMKRLKAEFLEEYRRIKRKEVKGKM